MKRTILLCAAGLLALAACGRDADETAPETETGEIAAPDPETGETGGAPADVADDAQDLSEAVPSGDRPLVQDFDTEYANISVTLPEEAASDPALYDLLMRAAEAEAEEAREVARDGHAASEQDGFPFHTHELDIAWETEFANGEVLSLLKTVYVFQGGAHPNTYYDALNWRRDSHSEFGIDDVITGQTGYEALSVAAEAALMAEKRERLGEGLTDAEYWKEDVIYATAPTPENFQLFTLAPSASDAAKAGGIALHYAPYAVGPYAEGAYSIVIPQAAFADYITDRYAGLFAGEPED